MDIADILTPERTQLGIRSASKKRILETLSELLAPTTPENDVRALFEGLCARERRGNTGLGHGVALPHARLACVSAPAAVLLRLEDAVDYEAPDRAPVDLVFGLVVPEDSTSTHLELLAQVAQRFSDAGIREALRAATTDAEAHGLMTQSPPSN